MKPKYYLDTNVFLKWLNGEDSRGYSTDAGLIELILNNEINCVTSNITQMEVLECHTKPQSWDLWKRFQSRKNVSVLVPNSRIINLAMEIRNYYAAQRKHGVDGALKPPCVPDCIHVATAIYADCDVMYSRDRGATSKKYVSPIGMSGDVMGKHKLIIKEPIEFSQAMSHTS